MSKLTEIIATGIFLINFQTAFGYPIILKATEVSGGTSNSISSLGSLGVYEKEIYLLFILLLLLIVILLIWKRYKTSEFGKKGSKDDKLYNYDEETETLKGDMKKMGKLSDTVEKGNKDVDSQESQDIKKSDKDDINMFKDSNITYNLKNSTSIEVIYEKEEEKK
ncbi:maltodextrin utilization protein YvdJ [Methanococcus voltae PS]|uniref:Maltodextrin utilization protein YvdJ n=1 Tax=Methanococcus voltae PS TaxID=523842 RepID=A0ABT2EZ15_METVO|nr:hypothetical protein [Methanococcus voltae]MCS3922303.1 maltodextrin utilization protein YvdJ [Methanococcus voltae PS]